MPMQEARKNQRSPTYLGASIYFDDKSSTFDCLVKNLSENGARLAIDTVWDIPRNFRLYIPKYNDYYTCLTKWKTHNNLGVHFSKLLKSKSASE